MSDQDFAAYASRHCKKHRYSAAYRDYWIAHRFCEVGVAEGHVRYATPPHHLRTRGAGGGDSHENLLALCTECHADLHQVGARTFARMHPCVRGKLRRALRKERSPK